MSRSSLRYPLQHPDRHWQARLTPAPDLLAATGSLTAALRAMAPAFNVQVTRELWLGANEDERALLGVRRGCCVWAREVLLCDGAVPLVFAHSVAAARDLPHWPWLRGLGNKPLGEVLFRHPRVVRLPLRYRRLDGRHPLFHAACDAAAVDESALPARRSLFVLDRRPLLTTEVFLPNLLRRLG